MTAPLPRRIAWFAPWTWKRRTQIVAGLLLALVGYPLSFGPAVGLLSYHWISITTYRAIYWPMIKLLEVHPLVADLIDWYCSFFHGY